ncbi:MAG: Hsp20/alpha crystallin family protein [Solobacterium sp.]|nr:Hsp20/alpha crystallin family protein [Solobacterium sp.]MCH4222602.1 Hsp20/alpha crystallin family protein [Solobacterium sp.]MCH4265065.1 Hsp20/alpha crystallin family protein [Solobacterium sp.]
MMRYTPARHDMFNNFFGDMFPGFSNDSELMRTDVHEKDGRYLLDVDMPGFKKEDVKVSLNDGTLTISAEHHDTNEEKDAKGNVLRQERYSGSCKRSFYVGDSIKQSDIHASYRNGTLSLDIPSAAKKESEEQKFIEIQ